MTNDIDAVQHSLRSETLELYVCWLAGKAPVNDIDLRIESIRRFTQLEPTPHVKGIAFLFFKNAYGAFLVFSARKYIRVVGLAAECPSTDESNKPRRTCAIVLDKSNSPDIAASPD